MVFDGSFVEDFNQSSTAAVVFQGISLLRVLASRVKDSKTENEIWKVEEIPGSPLLRNTIEKDGMHWLEQRFGGKYRRTKPTWEPGHQRHFVLLTDYLDVELICTGYVVSQK